MVSGNLHNKFQTINYDFQTVLALKMVTGRATLQCLVTLLAVIFEQIIISKRIKQVIESL